jgi:hypothetical protein
MSAPVDVSRPSALWKTLSEERRLEAATAFWQDDQSVAEQAEAIGAIARQINFRPRSVLALPVERRARQLARMLRVSEPLAGRLLVSYHLAHQRPMMSTFLDALGIKHEDGLIAEEDVKPPESERLIAAGRELTTKFRPEDVHLYFATLLVQDPATWGPLGQILDEVKRWPAPAEPEAGA